MSIKLHSGIRAAAIAVLVSAATVHGQSRPATTTPNTPPPPPKPGTVVTARPYGSALADLRAQDLPTRIKALEAVTADPMWRSKPEVRKALVALLEEENARIQNYWDKNVATSAALGEEYTHYFYSELLLPAVTSFAFPEGKAAQIALLRSAYAPSSRLAKQIAAFGSNVVGEMLTLSKSRRLIDREKVAGVMGEWLHLEQESRVDKDQRRRSVELALMRLARDTQRGVRLAAVPALARWGGNEAVQELEAMASSDPGPVSLRAQGREVHMVREAAARALAKLRNR